MDTAPPEPAGDTPCMTVMECWHLLQLQENMEWLAIVDSISADLEAKSTGQATVH